MAINYFFEKNNKCDLCKEIKDTIAFDCSLGEYNAESLCLDCIIKIFKKKKDGKIYVLEMRN